MVKMTKLIGQLLGGIATLRLADLYMSGIYFDGDIETLIFAGLMLGFLNFFIKPILKIITLPLRILTLGLFSFIINIAIVYFIDLAFYELIFEGLGPLIGFIILLWLVNMIFSLILE